MNKIVSGILFIFTLVLIGLSFSSYWDSVLSGRDVPVFIDYLIDIGFISAFLLWLWMLGNFFKAGPKRARIIVGFAMLFLNIIAAPVYWLVYYVRQPNT